MDQTAERLALDAVGGLWWDWNMETGRVVWSEGLRCALGIQDDAVGYEAWIERVHPDDAPRVQAGLSRIVVSRDDRYEHSYRIRFADERYIAVVDRVRIVRDEAWKPLRAIGVMVMGVATGELDGTERGAKEFDAAVRAERACHDLNNARLVLDASLTRGDEKRVEAIRFALDQIERVTNALHASDETGMQSGGPSGGQSGGGSSGGGTSGAGFDGGEWRDASAYRRGFSSGVASEIASGIALVDAMGDETGRVSGEDESALDGLLVLVVEDTDVVRRLLVESLELAGCEVLEAADGVEAMGVCAKLGARIDVGVTDLVMPRKDGVGLIKESREKGLRFPWLVLTGGAGASAPTGVEGIGLEGLEGVEVLGKPLEMVAVRRALVRLLGRVKQMSDETAE